LWLTLDVVTKDRAWLHAWVSIIPIYQNRYEIHV